MTHRRRWALRVAGFLLVLVVADAAARWLRIEYWTPFENDRALAVYVYQQQREAADVLFLGTSRINAAVIPSIVEEELIAQLGQPHSTFVLGQPGSSTLTSWLVLRNVVASNGSPRLVVLELSPGSLNAHHRDTSHALRSYATLHDLVWAAPRLRSWGDLVGASGGAFRGIASGTLFALRATYRDSVEPKVRAYARKQGAQYPRVQRWQHRRLADLTDAQRRTLLSGGVGWARYQYLSRYEIGGVAEAAFRAICRLARAHGFQLIVVDPPVAADYRDRATTPEERRQFRSYLDRVARDNAALLPRLDVESLELTDADFLNLTHLHPDGAARYSRLIARSALAPLLAPSSGESQARTAGSN